ncbi:MAG TPA: MFS transporter [Ktedonobacteraceae bacterium]|nr:MFS transporter [Ktedonobacteraceae bacterium]
MNTEGRIDQPEREPSAPDGQMTWMKRLSSVPGVIWYSSASALFGYISFFLLLSALPVYFTHLGYQAAQIGLIVGSTYAINFLAYFLTAMVTDRWGGRTYMMVSALALALTPLIFEGTQNFWVFIVASVWQGLTMSAFATAVTAYVGQKAPADRRGTIMALFGVFPNLAQAAAPPLGILVGARLGYPLLFDLSAASAIIAALIVFILPRHRIVSAHFSLRTWVRGVQRLAQPGLVQFVLGVCRGVTIAFLPVYMLRGGVGNPGLFFTWQIGAIVLLRPVSGLLSDRYGRLALVLPSLLFMAGGIAILAFPASYLTLTLSGIIFGIAVSVLVPTVLAWTFDVSSADQRGLASGIYNTLYDLGRAGSAFGFGFVIVTSGYPSMFLLVSAIPILTIVVLVFWQMFSHRTNNLLTVQPVSTGEVESQTATAQVVEQPGR